MKSLLLIHIFCCWFMTGVIWLVQIHIYPLFKKLGQSDFDSIHKFHMRQITWIVAPLMGIEFVSGLALVFIFPDNTIFVNFFLVLSLWALTGFINVPSHNQLNYEAESSKVNLVRWNWPRTFIWSFRSIFLFYILVTKFNGGGL